jgi:hypothetical protein
MPDKFKITPNPEYDALHAFDAENNFGPIRETAERITSKYGIDWRHPIVDEISHALEDMLDLGQRRAAYLPKNSRDN